ncbi:MAG: hypothetical protein MOGMAGMI_01780 [Candidatus Omnitrophica bacterium]|nr:hypothetical protein [Candidatus Omnitrophota bacterium]
MATATNVTTGTVTAYQNVAVSGVSGVSSVQTATNFNVSTQTVAGTVQTTTAPSTTTFQAQNVTTTNAGNVAVAVSAQTGVQTVTAQNVGVSSSVATATGVSSVNTTYNVTGTGTTATASAVQTSFQVPQTITATGTDRVQAVNAVATQLATATNVTTGTVTAYQNVAVSGVSGVSSVQTATNFNVSTQTVAGTVQTTTAPSTTTFQAQNVTTTNAGNVAVAVSAQTGVQTVTAQNVGVSSSVATATGVSSVNLTYSGSDFTRPGLVAAYGTTQNTSSASSVAGQLISSTGAEFATVRVALTGNVAQSGTVTVTYDASGQVQQVAAPRTLSSAQVSGDYAVTVAAQLGTTADNVRAAVTYEGMQVIVDFNEAGTVDAVLVQASSLSQVIGADQLTMADLTEGGAVMAALGQLAQQIGVPTAQVRVSGVLLEGQSAATLGTVTFGTEALIAASQAAADQTSSSAAPILSTPTFTVAPTLEAPLVQFGVDAVDQLAFMTFADTAQADLMSALMPQSALLSGLAMQAAEQALPTLGTDRRDEARRAAQEFANDLFAGISVKEAAVKFRERADRGGFRGFSEAIIGAVVSEAGTTDGQARGELDAAELAKERARFVDFLRKDKVLAPRASSQVASLLESGRISIGEAKALSTLLFKVRSRIGSHNQSLTLEEAMVFLMPTNEYNVLSKLTAEEYGTLMPVSSRMRYLLRGLVAQTVTADQGATTVDLSAERARDAVLSFVRGRMQAVEKGVPLVSQPVMIAVDESLFAPAEGETQADADAKKESFDKMADAVDRINAAYGTSILLVTYDGTAADAEAQMADAVAQASAEGRISKDYAFKKDDVTVVASESNRAQFDDWKKLVVVARGKDIRFGYVLAVALESGSFVSSNDSQLLKKMAAREGRGQISFDVSARSADEDVDRQIEEAMLAEIQY